MFNEIKEALEWLESRPNTINFETFSKVYHKLGISSMIPMIHVAGTNGKGSTVDYLRSVMQKGGYKVGTFVSPYLYQHNDRIRIDNIPIDDDTLLSLINHWYSIAVEHHLSMFQLDFLMMLDYFNHNKVEVMIIETGIGGRFDCTNVINPILTIITTIGRDHQSLLGASIEEIAWQKAGIIKPSIPIVVGKLGPTSLEVIEEEALKQGSPVIKTSAIKAVKPGLFHYKQFMDINLQSDALFQMENAALALEASMYLMKIFLNLKPYLIQLGIEQTFFEGRFERIKEGLWIDGAHNIDGLQHLIYDMKLSQHGPIEVVYAGLKREDQDELLKYLHRSVDHLILTTFEDERIYDIESYRGIYDIEENYETLLKAPSTGVRILTGSLHFVSVIKQSMKKSSN